MLPLSRNDNPTMVMPFKLPTKALAHGQAGGMP
jgi:hypothetical protein